MGIPIPQNPYLPPEPLDPHSSANDDESEFGVGIGYQRRLAARGVPPEAGGPYRGLSPGRARRDGRQHRRYGAEQIAP